MIFAAPPPSAAAAASQAPTAAEAAEVERRYTPPRRGAQQAAPLEGYVRSYWRDPAEPDVVRGQYVRADGGRRGPPRVRLLASAREVGNVSDGGCSVVNVAYHLGSGALDARCGGR